MIQGVAVRLRSGSDRPSLRRGNQHRRGSPIPIGARAAFATETLRHRVLSRLMHAISSESLEMLSEDECLGLLRSHAIGRIAFAFEGKVEIFPVNYGVEGRVIVFRTGAGTKLHALRGVEVAFEIDGWDPDLGIGWSVVARGGAEEITTNLGRAAEHLRWVPVDPAAPGDRWHWIGIKPLEIAGRRFHGAPTEARCSKRQPRLRLRRDPYSSGSAL
jgi:nitroimidazol reductase NimA-like FMN-containing flavoprotein (pyridoxamine 5'-phosphate oxidase superfamily)